MITTKKITSDEFAGMREEWNGLLSRADCRSPMLTWEWMFTWWEHYGAGRELYVMTARLPGGWLVGVAPFVLREAVEFRMKFNRIEFIGTGEPEEDETCSEFLDVIVDPSHITEVSEAFVGELAGDDRWGELLVKDVRNNAVVRKLCDSLVGTGGCHVRPVSCDHCPRIELPATWEQYLDSITPKRAERIAYERRRLEREHKVEFKSSRDVAAISDAYQHFVRLHQERWVSAGKTGCFGSEAFSRFLLRVTERLSEKGKLQVSCLMVGDEVVAAYYLFRHADSVYYYNSGVVVDRYSKMSVGNVTLGFIIQEAIENGCEEFHFFKGAVGSYKSHWTEQAVKLISFVVARKSIGQNVVAAIRKGRSVAGGIRDKAKRLLRPEQDQ